MSEKDTSVTAGDLINSAIQDVVSEDDGSETAATTQETVSTDASTGDTSATNEQSTEAGSEEEASTTDGESEGESEVEKELDALLAEEDSEEAEEDGGKPPRSEKRIKELLEQNKRLKESIEELSGKTAKKDDTGAIDLSEYDPQKIDELKAIMEQLGLKDVKQTVEMLKQQSAEAERQQLIAQDQLNLKAAADEYSQKLGVDKEKLESAVKKQVAEWANNNHPRAELPYEDIMQLMFAKHLAKRDVDQVLSGKTSDPAVEKDAPSMKSEKSNDVDWNNSTPSDSREAFIGSILSSL